MKNKEKEKQNAVLRWTVIISIWTFFLAVIFSFLSQFILSQVTSTIITFLVLIITVLIGIFFDLIGVSATSASEAPINAKAAKKVYGAKKANNLVKNRDQVANFCADVIGDIAGIASGTITTILVMRLITHQEMLGSTALNIVLTAFISAFTVGGKSIGKYLAVTKGTYIIYIVGIFLTKLEEFISIPKRYISSLMDK
ncbi:hypothetical protein [Natranaerobius trueperi]|uniref:Mg2+ and Co2+ transporter CorB n=1 Tax=Natranaerobius trueperi TaxID=759412 RepID=A0A226BYC2_9FIRM|nr:hypothetical protein [Natranaerobius trueperi]OWZ84013.1 hypothetical protein CDO51_05495 [Natranaerobius trueperi]